jgi:hypothetical protein
MMNRLKAGETKAAPEGGPKKNWFGKRNAAAMGLGVATVGALLFARHCGDGQDRLPPPAPVVEKKAAPECVPPVKGDGKCELEKGEHDSSSKNFDPASCGYCGDAIAQEWETIEACPVDFACGNGKVDRNVVYGAFIAPAEGEGVYKLGTITVTESCREKDENYCSADCGPKAPAPAHSGRRAERAAEPAPARTAAPAPASANCPAEITGRFRGRIGDSLTGNPGPARNAAGATSQVVKARVSISVRGGTGTVTGIGLSCQDCAGGSLSPGTVNLGGITVDPGMTCTTTVVVNIPPG